MRTCTIVSLGNMRAVACTCRRWPTASCQPDPHPLTAGTLQNFLRVGLPGHGSLSCSQQELRSFDNVGCVVMTQMRGLCFCAVLSCKN
jgi:hypothetical protein